MRQLRHPLLPVLALLAVSSMHPAVAQEQTYDPLTGAPVQAEPAAEEPQQPPLADLSEATEKIRAGAYAEAEALLAALQPEFPDDPALLLMRGEVLLAVGRPDEAATVLEHGVEVDPERPRMHFQLATALASTGKRDQALKQFAREIEVNADPTVQVLAHLNRSMLLEQGRAWADAAGEFEAVLVLEPTRLEAYGDLASLYIQAGEIDAAMDALQRGKAAGFDSAPHYYSLGARLYNSGKYDDAVTVLNEALRVDPNLAMAERSLAATLEKLDRKPEAAEHLRRYLELNPGAPDSDAVKARIREFEKAAK
jgi:tetratricopeptide (TPR) repeat protein